MVKPMLASPVKVQDIKYPVFVSPKLDGVRALVIDGVVMSRNLKPIPNKHVQRLFGRRELNDLDGELIVGSPTAKDVFQKTSSGVMSIEGEPDVRFYVFDSFRYPNDHFTTRYLKALIQIEPFEHVAPIEIVDQAVVGNTDIFTKMENRYLAFGYEGLMIRSGYGHYKFGRSTKKEGLLLKVKRFTDSEAKIVGWRELMTNTNEAKINELGQKARSHKKAGMVPADMLGAWIVEDLKTGQEFDIGTGFTDSQRIEFWKNRAIFKHVIVKYKYQEVGVKDKPRFPVFIGFRDKRDM
jgi:DNA ligase-1